MKLFVATKALIFFEGKALILRESSAYDDGIQSGKYDVPGGRIDPHESLFDALAREVLEETGLTIEVGEQFHTSEQFLTIKGEDCHIIRLYFACTATTDEVTLSIDHDSFEWIDPAKHTDYNIIESVNAVFEKYLAKN